MADIIGLFGNARAIALEDVLAPLAIINEAAGKVASAGTTASNVVDGVLALDEINATIAADAGDDRISDHSAVDTTPGGARDDAGFDLAADDQLFGRPLSSSGEIASPLAVIDGTPGPDQLTGTAANDTIRGFAGNDTINGGAGDDLLIGNAGDDTIDGGTGRDTISGGSGDDLISGRDGVDNLSGGNGDDRLFGNAGNDRLVGDAGDDRLFGGAGRDTAIGGSGNDTLSGGAGNDVLSGGPDDDFLFGGAGQDLLLGGAGSDSLDGNEGNDRLLGRLGDDNLFAGLGNDQLEGGAGRDTFFFDEESGDLDEILDFNQGERDSLFVSNEAFNVVPTPANTANLVRAVDQGDDAVLQIDPEGTGSSFTDIAVLTGNAGIELDIFISGTSGNVLIS